MDFLGFGPSHNKTESLLDQNEAEQIPELVNLLSKHVFHKNGPQNAKQIQFVFL